MRKEKQKIIKRIKKIENRKSRSQKQFLSLPELNFKTQRIKRFLFILFYFLNKCQETINLKNAGNSL
jgi:hypothetical protein